MVLSKKVALTSRHSLIILKPRCRGLWTSAWIGDGILVRRKMTCASVWVCVCVCVGGGGEQGGLEEHRDRCAACSKRKDDPTDDYKNDGSPGAI